MAQARPGVEVAMGAEVLGGEGPLHTRTWALDLEEGQAVATMRRTHLEAFPEPLLQVPDDLERKPDGHLS